MFVSVEVKIVLGLLVFVANNAVGRCELGHHQAAAAQIANETAEDGIRHASHGREHGSGTNFDAADGEAWRDECHLRVGLSQAIGEQGIFEILAHLAILQASPNAFVVPECPARRGPRWTTIRRRFWKN